MKATKGKSSLKGAESLRGKTLVHRLRAAVQWAGRDGQETDRAVVGGESGPGAAAAYRVVGGQEAAHAQGDPGWAGDAVYGGQVQVRGVAVAQAVYVGEGGFRGGGGAVSDDAFPFGEPGGR